MHIWIVVFILLALPVSARAQEPEASDNCFDLAVVARLKRQTPDPIPYAGPDEIVVRWPWMLTFATEQVIIGQEGRRRINVTASMHAPFNHRIRHFLLFLRREPAGGYSVMDMAFDVIRDHQGQFIMPFEQPYESEHLRPNGWLPQSYEHYLRPIRYRARDAWWLVDPDVNPDEAAVPPGWQTRRSNVVVALQGLYVSDLARLVANEPNAVCDRQRRSPARSGRGGGNGRW